MSRQISIQVNFVTFNCSFWNYVIVSKITRVRALRNSSRGVSYWLRKRAGILKFVSLKSAGIEQFVHVYCTVWIKNIRTDNISYESNCSRVGGVHTRLGRLNRKRIVGVTTHCKSWVVVDVVGVRTTENDRRAMDDRFDSKTAGPWTISNN